MGCGQSSTAAGVDSPTPAAPGPGGAANGQLAAGVDERGSAAATHLSPAGGGPADYPLISAAAPAPAAPAAKGFRKTREIKTGYKDVSINVIEPTATSVSPEPLSPGTLAGAGSGAGYSFSRSELRSSTQVARSTMHDSGISGNMPEVMIIYDKSDLHYADLVKDQLIAVAGVRVWTSGAEEPAQSTSRAHSDHDHDQDAKALIDAKVVVVIMSASSARSQRVQDQLCLAYISEKRVFPVGLQYFKHIDQYMTPGLKLMLSKINWVFLVKEETIPEILSKLVESVQVELQRAASAANRSQVSEEDVALQHKDNEGPGFWQRHFSSGEAQENAAVQWRRFRETSLEDYRSRLSEEFPDESHHKWFINLFYQDVLEFSKTVSRRTYDKFCGVSSGGDGQTECGGDTLTEVDGPHRFYERLHEYAVGTFAIKEVFAMDSEVRWTAIMNLVRFQTPAVVNALLDLTVDKDHKDDNLRVVATLALGRLTGAVSNHKLVYRLQQLLRDTDRLVRQSACISTGALRITSQTIVNLLIDIWRNDPIRDVREASLLALEVLSDTRAQICIKMTRQLQSDVNQLTTT